jgi:lipoprotein-anchoring transpeptidase ErfK/SrfK
VSTVIARRDKALSRQDRCFAFPRFAFLRGGVGVAGVAAVLAPLLALPFLALTFLALTFLALTSIASPAEAARYYWGWSEHDYYWPRPKHRIAHKDKGAVEADNKKPFGDIPKGPLQIVISIDQQKLHLYSDGLHVADTSIATGVPSLPTPLGVFSVIQKQVFHRSNIYSNAPMPFMQRITWSGVAMHEGENIGHPASHGCIRMPHDFAARLYRLTKLGVRVIISRPELKPADIADAHLFVHKDMPAETPAPAAPASPNAEETSAGKSAASDTPVPATAASATAPADPKVETPAASSSLTADNSGGVPAPSTQLADTVKAAVAKATPITVFISRKQSRLYVRQDFEPLFDVPITIAQPDKPLGTHVFTALEFTGPDHTALRWNVVSLPAEAPKRARYAEHHSRYGKHGRGQRLEEDENIAADPPPPPMPAEILARIDIPADVIQALSALIGPGSSLVVSDQGLGGETGEGTDFIVVTR